MQQRPEHRNIKTVLPSQYFYAVFVNSTNITTNIEMAVLSTKHIMRVELYQGYFFIHIYFDDQKEFDDSPVFDNPKGISIGSIVGNSL